MRLQSAIFTLPDALLDGGALRPGADKVLSILKMESVWLYAVTALDRTEAQALLRSAGIEGDFRGLLTEREAGCAVCSGTMLEKAMRRLRSQKADTVVFTGTLALVETAKKAGFRAVAVGGAAEGDEWRQMCIRDRQGKTSGGGCALSPTTSCRTTRTGSGWNKTAYEKRRTAASSFFHPYSFFSLGASKSALITLA